MGLSWYSSTSAAPVGGFFTKPYCANSDGQGRGDSGFAELYEGNTCFIHSSDIYGWGDCDPTDPFDLVPLPVSNVFHTDNGNVTIECGGKSLSLTEWQGLGMDVGSVVRGPANVSYIIEQAKAKLGM